MRTERTKRRGPAFERNYRFTFDLGEPLAGMIRALAANEHRSMTHVATMAYLDACHPHVAEIDEKGPRGRCPMADPLNAVAAFPLEPCRIDSPIRMRYDGPVGVDLRRLMELTGEHPKAHIVRAISAMHERMAAERCANEPRIEVTEQDDGRLIVSTPTPGVRIRRDALERMLHENARNLLVAAIDRKGVAA